MLPQKKNPDVAELARGRAGRLVGHLTGVLTMLKGLPLAYNRDLQDDKPPLFDAVDSVVLAVAALRGLLSTATFATDRMAAAADAPSIAAVDLAEHLVARGVPFREAHARVAALVRAALDGSGSLPELVAADPDLGPEAAERLAPGEAVRRRTTAGGAGPGPVAVQLVRYRAALGAERDRLGAVLR
jgi:argininosuccinate lyase